MKLTFDREKFISAVKWTNSILDKGHLGKDDGNEDFSSIRIKPIDKGRVRFSSYSANTSERTIIVDADIEDPIQYDSGYLALELAASALSRLPAQITSDKVVLSYDTDHNASKAFADVGLQVTLPVLSSQEQSKPVTTNEGATHIGDFSVDELASTLTMLSCIPENSQSATPMTMSIDFRPDPEDDSKMNLMATDTFTLSIRSIDYKRFYKDGEFKPIAIPLSDLNSMFDSDSHGIVSLYLDNTDDRYILFSFDDDKTSKINRMDVPALDDRIYQSMIVPDRDQYFDVDYETIYNAIHRLGMWNKDDIICLDLNKEDQTLDIRTQDNSWTTTIPVSNINVDRDGYHVEFTYSNIYKPLKTMNYPKVRYMLEDGGTNVIVWKQLKSDDTADDSTYIISTFSATANDEDES